MDSAEERGSWCVIRSGKLAPGHPALFLDRDGTIIDLIDYLSDPSQVVLIPNMVTLLRNARAAGRAIVMVTNQSGVGRGYYGWKEFEAVQNRIYELLAAENLSIDAIYACSHPPASAGGPKGSAYRKPAPGMLLKASVDLGLDLSASVIVGDTADDLEAGKSAGLQLGALVTTGYGKNAIERQKALKLSDDKFRVTFEMQNLI